jgi:DNA-directed RNA polymerase subunit RPC12/RpoP
MGKNVGDCEPGIIILCPYCKKYDFLNNEDFLVEEQLRSLIFVEETYKCKNCSKKICNPLETYAYRAFCPKCSSDNIVKKILNVKIIKNKSFFTNCSVKCFNCKLNFKVNLLR